MAVDDVSFKVRKGMILGIIGPNGAGKTTAFNLLNGFFEPTAGEVLINGRNMAGLKPHEVCAAGVGRTFQIMRPFMRMSVAENVVVGAFVHASTDEQAHRLAQEAIEKVGLSAIADRIASELTSKELRLMELARALAGQPQLLLLDEPVNGLDPNGMVEIRELLKELNQQKGITIFISSHLLHEVEKMCTHIGIIHRGIMRFEGKINELANAAGSGPTIIVSVANADHWISILQPHYSDARILESDKIAVSMKNREDAIQLNRTLVMAGAEVSELKIQDSLEDWFMQITQN
jgi:branched-chain amino acid transport system permease protein